MFSQLQIGQSLHTNLLLEVVHSELLRFQSFVEDILLLKVGPRLRNVPFQSLLKLLNLGLGCLSITKEVSQQRIQIHREKILLCLRK